MLARMNDNQAQIESWAGRAGAEWTRRQDLLDRTMGPLGALAIEAAHVADGERILDVGCGCGDTTLALATLAGPAGQVTGVDVSPPMLARARSRAMAARTGAAIDFLEADASAAALPGERDLVFSRFGVMFFADPIAAFAHLRAAQRRGGRLAFVCWTPAKEQAWVDALVRAVAPHLPPHAPGEPHAPGPFAFAEADYVRSVLSRAGYTDVALARHQRRLCWTTTPSLDDAVDFFTHISPVSRRIADAPEAMQPAARDALRTELARHLGPDGVAFDSAVWVVTARG
jgi:SAM-dependent methyltransferase